MGVRESLESVLRDALAELDTDAERADALEDLGAFIPFMVADLRSPDAQA